MGKPLPPEPIVPWPVRAAWAVRVWLSWPWQVRQMKAAGFRRVGWMTWETGPELRAAITDEILTLPAARPERPPHPRGPLSMLGDGIQFLGQVGMPVPGQLPDETMPFRRLPVTATFPIYVLADQIDADIAALADLPQHDVLADLREAMQFVEQMPPRRELHCAPDVAGWFARQAPGAPPSGFGLAALLGIDVIAEGDMPPGQWQIRDAEGTIVDGGKL